ncbi:hypothetical protein VBM87_01210 [Mycoplasma sp. 744]|uniref:hypothetical protein n=1 Tax=Mycoplasma sp. 744 TaxID=3108531 RepID=UPI002B1CE825|nr:hypothetical protein [Mycoplasma sp. 744]MEA4115400.1 hypothetical protein [Mycoplasma sp. 744]
MFNKNTFRYKLLRAFTKEKIIFEIILFLISLAIALGIYFKNINNISNSYNHIALWSDSLLGASSTIIVFNILAMLLYNRTYLNSKEKTKNRKLQVYKFDLEEEKRKHSNEINSKIKIKQLEEKIAKLEKQKSVEVNDLAFGICLFVGIFLLIISIIIAYV